MPDLSLPRQPRASALAGDYVEKALRSVGWPDGDLSRVVVAVSEAVSNAVEHGGGEDGGSILLRLATDAGACEVRVDDGGAGPDPESLRTASLPRREALSGRGLYILTTLADEVHVGPSGVLALTFTART